MHLSTSSQTSPRRLRLGPRGAAESGSHSPPLPLPVLFRVPPVPCPGRGCPPGTVVHSAVLTLRTFPEGRRFTGPAATPAVPGSASADSRGFVWEVDTSPAASYPCVSLGRGAPRSCTGAGPPPASHGPQYLAHLEGGTRRAAPVWPPAALLPQPQAQKSSLYPQNHPSLVSAPKA